MLHRFQDVITQLGEFEGSYDLEYAPFRTWECQVPNDPLWSNLSTRHGQAIK